MRTTWLSTAPRGPRAVLSRFAMVMAMAIATVFACAIHAATSPSARAGDGPPAKRSKSQSQRKTKSQSALAGESGLQEAPGKSAIGEEKGQPVPLADCPVAVRKTFESEARGAKARSIIKEKDEHGPSIYWIDADLAGRVFVLAVLEDGTLLEMNMAVDGAELPLEKCSEAVRKTFEREGFGARIDSVGQDRKFGAPIYVALVEHAGKSYQLVVAHDGTLVEKALVIEDEEVALKDCPQAVRTALHEHAQGGSIGEITRSTGIIQPTYETELKMKRRVYLIEIAEDGALISKSLEAGEE